MKKGIKIEAILLIVFVASLIITVVVGGVYFSRDKVEGIVTKVERLSNPEKTAVTINYVVDGNEYTKRIELGEHSRVQQGDKKTLRVSANDPEKAMTVNDFAFPIIVDVLTGGTLLLYIVCVKKKNDRI